MPRYLVERTFSRTASASPPRPTALTFCLTVVGRNAEEGMTWIHSYVTADKDHHLLRVRRPDPEAIRRVAARNSLQVDQISEVSLLDPYFCH